VDGPLTRILIIQGHPDGGRAHLCGALAQAYADGAGAAGHEVRTVMLAGLSFPLLHSQHAWEHGPLPPGLQAAQDAIGWAQHLVIVFPLWLGDMPALLKGFLEQVMRPGFAFGPGSDGIPGGKALRGKSARIVVTMGMPALAYRWWYGAHSLKSMKRNILAFVGIAPVRDSVIGMVGKLPAARAGKWFARMRALGQAGK